jgi:hypothetical protein
MMAELGIGGVLVLALIVGIVEFSKKFGLSGTWLIVETFVLAFLFGGLALAISDGLIPEQALKYVELVVGAIAFALGACGLYDVGKRFSKET